MLFPLAFRPPFLLAPFSPILHCATVRINKMGSCLSTIKIIGSNGCNSNAEAPNYAAPKNYYRKEAPKMMTNMTGNNQKQRRNNADAIAKARLQQGRARRADAIPCGKKTNFGYAKDFDHKYTIGRLLGHGQFGFTYVATDKLTGDCVAVKKIDKNKMVRPIAVEDVKREVKISLLSTPASTDLWLNSMLLD